MPFLGKFINKNIVVEERKDFSSIPISCMSQGHAIQLTLSATTRVRKTKGKGKGAKDDTGANQHERNNVKGLQKI